MSHVFLPPFFLGRPRCPIRFHPKSRPKSLYLLLRYEVPLWNQFQTRPTTPSCAAGLRQPPPPTPCRLLPHSNSRRVQNPNWSFVAKNMKPSPPSPPPARARLPSPAPPTAFRPPQWSKLVSKRRPKKGVIEKMRRDRAGSLGGGHGAPPFVWQRLRGFCRRK